jgi:hypothetical protein
MNYGPDSLVCVAIIGISLVVGVLVVVVPMMVLYFVITTLFETYFESLDQTEMTEE